VVYYRVVLLRSCAPALTYSYEKKLQKGTIVSVPRKTTQKDAVVVEEETTVPSFDTSAISSVSGLGYTQVQMEIAKFISEYYFSSFSEAISLFLPYPVGCCAPTTPQPLGKKTVGAVGAQHPTLSVLQQKAYEQLLL
jgi:primosomal protein N' (replication factor Y)